MRATAIEYRLRYFVHFVIYVLEFWAPWERYTSLSAGSSTLWLYLAALPARAGWLSFAASSRVVLAVGCTAAVLGAVLRVWGASYLGAPVVHAGGLHGTGVVADGPFRFMRNPLYVGTGLNTLALSLLMPPTGALVAILLIAVVQLRLIGAEEPFLAGRLGEAYAAYCRAVPRIVPAWRPRVAASGAPLRLWDGVLSEVFAVGTAVSFVALGSRYNSTLLLEGVVVSLGLSLVAQAFIGKAAEPAEV